MPLKFIRPEFPQRHLKSFQTWPRRYGSANILLFIQGIRFVVKNIRVSGEG
jgi:hypothetical protein